MSKLPVSIISPVRNCAAAMPGHAAHLRELAAIVEEIIIVDSDSTDGTLDILKRELAGLDVVFLNHPPGLYQSWNHALSQAKAPYLTVATVGDPLPADSLRRLVDTMQRLPADVVVSAPDILDDHGKPLAKKWPVHRFLDALKVTGPYRISGATWLTMAAGFYPMTLISSSAGNLYRTRLMQENPFPTEFGHAGDSAWSVQMSRKARWVIDPQVKAYFWMHAAAPERKLPNEGVARRTHAMLEQLLADSESFFQAEGVTSEIIGLLGEIPDLLLRKAMFTTRYQQARKRWMPWFFQPEIVRLRKEREEVLGTLKSHRARIFAFAKELSATKDGASA
jgi:hypothetical protein